MMSSRSLFITSFASICRAVLTGEVTNESSIQTITSFCQNSNDFPLFGVSLCVSPGQYTALFLISIVLASVTFLTLLSLLLFLCIQRSRRSKVDYIKSSIADITNPDNKNIKAVPSAPKSDKEISNVLRKIISNPAKNGIRQSHIHHSFPLPAAQESLLSSSNSFGDSFFNIDRSMDGETKPRYLNSIIYESDESDAGQPSLHRRDSYDYQEKYSTKL